VNRPIGQLKAFVAERKDGQIERRIETISDESLPKGDVTVRVSWSSVNYKDALAVSPTGRVARLSPLVPGIDLAGEIVESQAPEFPPGTHVIVHGYDLGVAHFGGYAEYARVPASWLVPLPAGLTLRQAMILGTAGFTAAISVMALEDRGLRPGSGPVLVLGATGGVGSTALAILAGRGYEVWASTGKTNEHDFLRSLGATQILSREETAAESPKPLESERWAAGVDPVGGASLAYVLRTLRYGGAVASSGLTGGTELKTSVFPFILRGVALLGIDSVNIPIERRRTLWSRIAQDYRPADLEKLATREIGLDQLDQALTAVLAGEGRGRTLVRINSA
jgi:putative YhdH/YhfP family quinone oxidoreductase